MAVEQWELKSSRYDPLSSLDLFFYFILNEETFDLVDLEACGGLSGC